MLDINIYIYNIHIEQAETYPHHLWRLVLWTFSTYRDTSKPIMNHQTPSTTHHLPQTKHNYVSSGNSHGWLSYLIGTSSTFIGFNGSFSLVILSISNLNSIYIYILLEYHFKSKLQVKQVLEHNIPVVISHSFRTWGHLRLELVSVRSSRKRFWKSLASEKGDRCSLKNRPLWG